MNRFFLKEALCKPNSSRRNNVFFGWYLMVLTTLFCSCGRNYESANQILPYELIDIPIKFPYLPNYENRIYIVQKDSTDILGAYNHMTTSIDFFDITHQNTLRSLPLVREGPNGVNGVTAMALENSSVIVKSMRDFILIDDSAQVRAKVSISIIRDSIYMYDGIKEYKILKSGVTLGNFISLYYDAANQELIHNIFPLSENSDKRYSGAIGARINLQDSTVNILPIQYPEELQQSDDPYESLASPNFTRNGDLIIYNFPWRSDVYSYHLKTGKYSKYNLRSLYTENEAKPFDDKNASGMDYTRYEFCSLRFERVHYVKNYNIYVRVHNNSRNDRSEPQSKYLMLINADFKRMAEYKLPENFTYCLCTENSLYFFVYDKENDDSYLRLAKIDLEALL